MSKVAVLFSGGLDSCIALGDALLNHEEVFVIMIDYGQVAALKEFTAGIDFVRAMNRKFGTPFPDGTTLKMPIYNEIARATNKELPPLMGGKSKGNNALPYRNLLFTFEALALCEVKGIDTLYVGYGYEKEGLITVWDSSYLFVDKANALIDWKQNIESDEIAGCSITEKHTKVFSPMYKQNRRSFILDRIYKGYPLDVSWSCYLGGEKHCGECTSCKNRFEILDKE